MDELVNEPYGLKAISEGANPAAETCVSAFFGWSFLILCRAVRQRFKQFLMKCKDRKTGKLIYPDRIRSMANGMRHFYGGVVVSSGELLIRSGQYKHSSVVVIVGVAIDRLLLYSY